MSPRLQCDNSLSSTLVIGALQFVGAGLVSHLASLGRDVRALASYESVLQGEELVWYRDQQLRAHHGVTVALANLTNSTQIERVLRQRAPSEIVFVAPGVSGELALSELGDHAINAVMERSLEEFGTILECLTRISPCTRVVLVSLAKHTPPPEGAGLKAHRRMEMIIAWMVTFELLISAYHNSYHIPLSIVRLNRVYGPWGRTALMMFRSKLDAGAKSDGGGYCWYIRDVIALILQVLEQPEQCLVLEMEPCSSNSQRPSEFADLAASLRWAASYSRGRIREPSASGRDDDVVFTSYFTSTEDFQRHRRHAPNHFQYIREFYWSLKKHGLRAVIFHDGLDSGFQHRLSSDHPKLSFSKVESLHSRSTNDARFYSYYQYLREHPDIDKVLLTDISDVEFQKDPFQLMSLLGDWLYVGTDIDIFPNMKMMPWIEERLRTCFGNYSVDAGRLSKLLHMDTVYNAGSIGGSRETVLDLLAMMVAYLDSAPTSLNCNMPSVNYAVHEHFFEKAFTGFPLTSRFLRHQSAPKGVYLVHK